MINQNLLSVGQLLKSGFKLFFEENCYMIKDPTGQEIFRVKMKDKSFLLEPMKKE